MCHRIETLILEIIDIDMLRKETMRLHETTSAPTQRKVTWLGMCGEGLTLSKSAQDPCAVSMPEVPT